MYPLPTFDLFTLHATSYKATVESSTLDITQIHAVG
ncbi:MAG: hypothetical protein QOH72_5020 [Solirubrobacteraceae bacterium]|jgi:hypothetical protein|nr:hypothetical protein [Solirubrobacteraceae bacterium]